MILKVFLGIWFLTISLNSIDLSDEEISDTVRIGILANRGFEVTDRDWGYLIAYLNNEIPSVQFELVPLGFDMIDEAVVNQSIDFVISNSAMYASWEYAGLANRIATTIYYENATSVSSFGSLIFTRSDNTEVQTIPDIRNKTVAAVDSASLGGWLAGYGLLKEFGLNYNKAHFHRFFTHSHDEVVFAVLSGEADVGIIRSTHLERMADEGLINLNDFKAIESPHSHPIYPFLVSTQLYPAWPFAALAHTNFRLSREVAIALFRFENTYSGTLGSGRNGWTVPLDYSPVMNLLRTLKISPFISPDPTLREMVVLLRFEILILTGVFLIIVIVSVNLWRAERRIQSTLDGKELMLQEVHHRIKNNMNTIYGLIILEEDRIKDKESREILVDVAKRVQAMQIMYTKLYQTTYEGSINLSEFLPDLLNEILANFEHKTKIKLHTSISNTYINPKLLSSLVIILNELLSNSVKHGFQNHETPEVFVQIRKSKDILIVTVTDNGGDFPSKEIPTSGFGLRLVEMLCEQHNGEMTITGNNNETSINIKLRVE